MRIFLSHSHADADIAAQLVGLFEDGLQLPRQEIFCSSLPGHGFQGGERFRSSEIAGVLEADLVICLLSPSFSQSAHCMVELGAALSKSHFPTLLSPYELPWGAIPEPVNDRIIKPLTESSTLDDLSESIRPDGNFDNRLWEDRRTAFLEQKPSTTKQSLVRGFWNEDIVDGAFYIGKRQKQSHSEQVASAIERRELLPTSLFYSTDQGAGNWLSLTEDATYSRYSDSIHFFSKASKTIASAIVQIVGSNDIDFVSLGPGDGQKDLYLLRELITTGLSSARPSYPFYYPFDRSVRMLEAAVSRVGTDDVIRRHLGQMKIISADFQELPLFSRLYQYRPGPNVISLLGNTLGNLRNEIDWLRSLRRNSMFENDLLLLEVGNLSGESDLVASLGQELRNKRFDFGPLAVLNVPYNPDLLSYETELACSQIPETATTVSSYANIPIGKADGTVEHHDDIRLSYTHRYKSDRMQSALETAGFEIEQFWLSPEKRNIIFLASNPG